MARYLTALFLLCWGFSLAPVSFAQRHHSYKTHSSTSHRSSKATRQKGEAVHVRGYYKKDGTYVSAYDRSAPSSGRTGASIGQPYRRNYVAPGYKADPSVRHDKHGKIKRSKAAKSAFERQFPCPSTGRTHGACPGYIVDHIDPLECGGADAPSNMQWQTVADAKTKDKTEGSCRQ